MKLLITPTSPYARKARIIVLEKRLDCEIIIASPWENDAQLLVMNPLRQVPALIGNNGEVVMDSRLICEYLDAQNGAPYFLPAAAEARLAVQVRAALVEGAMDAALNIVMAKRVAPEMDVPAWHEWLMNKVDAVLAQLNREAAARNGFDISDVGCFCLLDTLSFRMPNYGWRDTNPALAAWFDLTASRESLKQTDPRP